MARKMGQWTYQTGVTPVSSDPSVYIKQTTDKIPHIIAMHVDDSLQITKGMSALNKLSHFKPT